MIFLISQELLLEKELALKEARNIALQLTRKIEERQADSAKVAMKVRLLLLITET